MKKRGHRRTGSAALARLGEAAMFLSLLAVGAAGTWAVMSWWVVPHWQADYDFIETVATIRDKRIDEQKHALEATTYRPSFEVEYQFEGRTRRVWTFDASQDRSNDEQRAREILARYEVGQRYPAWFAPRQPERIVLERGGNWWVWLLLAIPIPFLTIGAGGLVYTALHWRASSERRAAMAQPTASGEGESFEPVAAPNVPSATALTNSPGTHLAWRLPTAATPGWRLFGAVVFCALTTVVTVACTSLAIANHVAGEADWWLDLLLLPLVAVMTWAGVLVARQWTISKAVGPTMVEIDALPLLPGRTFEIMVLQSGKLELAWLEVTIECIEQASYQQGTDVRTEAAVVSREVALRCERFRIDYDAPFSRKCLATIPVGAMHSFHAPSNEVRWRIVVRGEPSAWPVFEREFLVVVHPASGNDAKVEKPESRIEASITPSVRDSQTSIHSPRSLAPSCT